MIIICTIYIFYSAFQQLNEVYYMNYEMEGAGRNIGSWNDVFLDLCI